jgi:hypothetical protein
VAGPCEHGNEPSDSIKCWEYLDQMNDYQLLKITLLHGGIMFCCVRCGKVHERDEKCIQK